MNLLILAYAMRKYEYAGAIAIVVLGFAYIAFRTRGFKRFTINPVIELGDGSKVKLSSFVGTLMILAFLVLLFVAALLWFAENHDQPIFD